MTIKNQTNILASADEIDPREVYYTQNLDRLEGHPDFDRSSHELVLNLLYAYNVCEAELTRIFLPWGISTSAANLLDILDKQENRCAPLNEIGRLLIVSRANVTGLVDSLAKRGMVERVPHPKDRRIILAQLTAAGSELQQQLFPIKLKTLKELCRGLQLEEKATLKELLVRLRQGLRKQ